MSRTKRIKKNISFENMSIIDLQHKYISMYDVVNREIMIKGEIEENDFVKKYEFPKQRFEPKMEKIENKFSKIYTKKTKLEINLGIEKANEDWDKLNIKIKKKIKEWDPAKPKERWEIVHSVGKLKALKAELEGSITEKLQNTKYIDVLKELTNIQKEKAEIQKEMANFILSKIYDLQECIRDIEREFGSLFEEEQSDSEEYEQSESESESDEYPEEKISTQIFSSENKKDLIQLAKKHLSLNDLKSIMNTKGVKRYLVLSRK